MLHSKCVANYCTFFKTSGKTDIMCLLEGLSHPCVEINLLWLCWFTHCDSSKVNVQVLLPREHRSNGGKLVEFQPVQLTSCLKGRKTLGLRSFVANFSQAFCAY